MINKLLHAPYYRALRVSLAVHVGFILFAGFDVFDLFVPRSIELPPDVQVLSEAEFQQIVKQQKQKPKVAEKPLPKPAPKKENNTAFATLKNISDNVKKLSTASKDKVQEPKKAEVTKNQTELATKTDKKKKKIKKIDLSNLVIKPSKTNQVSNKALDEIEKKTKQIQQNIVEKPKEEKIIPEEEIAETTQQAVENDVESDLTREELTILREQIFTCWNPPIGAKNIEGLIIRVKVDLDAEGYLQNAKVLHKLTVNKSDPFYRTAVESALRAVYHPDCTPLQLPKDKYDVWQNTVLTFNPTEILK